MTTVPVTSDDMEWPQLLNEKFRLQSYDGGAFKNKTQYQIKNVLLPTTEPFHCSSNGSKFTAIFKCTQDCTITHVVVGANLAKCTEPLKSGLFWILDDQPAVDDYKKFDSIPIEELKLKYGKFPDADVDMKDAESHLHSVAETVTTATVGTGLTFAGPPVFTASVAGATAGTTAIAGSSSNVGSALSTTGAAVSTTSAYAAKESKESKVTLVQTMNGPHFFETSKDKKEVEIELKPWVEGKWLVVKFLDTHGSNSNVDLSVIAILGYTGKCKEKSREWGPWWYRTAMKPVVHPHLLSSVYSPSGWVCDGRDFPGGCRSRQTDFHQTSHYTVTFRNVVSGFDLCDKCVKDVRMGEISPAIAQADIEQLLSGHSERGDYYSGDIQLAKLACTRILHGIRRNWRYVVPFYLDAGLLYAIRSVLSKLDEITLALEEGNYRIVGNPQTTKKKPAAAAGGAAAAGAAEGEPAQPQRKKGGASMECQKKILRLCMHTLLTDMSHIVFNGWRGDLHPNDQVYYRNDKDEWVEGVFLYFSDSEELVIEEGSAKGQPPSSSGVLSQIWGGPQTSNANAGGEKPKTLKKGKDVWKRDLLMPEFQTATLEMATELEKGADCSVAAVESKIAKVDFVAANGEGCGLLFIALQNRCSKEVLEVLIKQGNASIETCGTREGLYTVEIAERMGYSQDVLDLFYSKERARNGHAQKGATVDCFPTNHGLALTRENSKNYDSSDNESVAEEEESEVDSEEERGNNLQEMLNSGRRSNSNKRKRKKTGDAKRAPKSPKSFLASGKKRKGNSDVLHKLTVTGLRERFAMKLLPVMHSIATSYPLSVSHNTPMQKADQMISSVSMSISQAEKMLHNLEYTFAGTMGPQLIPTGSSGHGPPAHAKNLLAVIDQLPVEGLYALEPLIKSPLFYDILSVSKRAYQSFTKIILALVTTDSLEVAYHGCKLLNVVARHATFLHLKAITDGNIMSVGESVIKSRYSQAPVQENVFCKLLRSFGVAKWVERIATTKLPRQEPKTIPGKQEPTQTFRSTSGLLVIRQPDTAAGQNEGQSVGSMLGFFRHCDKPEVAFSLQKESIKLLDQLNKNAPASTEIKTAPSPFLKINSLANSSDNEIWNCLVEFKNLLMSCRSTLDEENKCTSFELASVMSIPGTLLEVLSNNNRNMSMFHEVFKDVEDFKRLTAFLHEVIDLGETFPVWRHQQERGLKALTDVHSLRLGRLPILPKTAVVEEEKKDEEMKAVTPNTGTGATGRGSGQFRGLAAQLGGIFGSAGISPQPSAASAKKEEKKEEKEIMIPEDETCYLPESIRSKKFFLSVEPLVTVDELSHYLQQITPIVDLPYLKYCYSIVGAVVQIKEITYHILSFTAFSGEVAVPVHTLEKLHDGKGSIGAAGKKTEDTEEPSEVQQVLHLQQYELLSMPKKPVFTEAVAGFMARLTQLKCSLPTKDFLDVIMNLVDGLKSDEMAEVLARKVMTRKSSFGSLPASPKPASPKISMDTTAGLTSGVSAMSGISEENKPADKGKDNVLLNDYQCKLVGDLHSMLIETTEEAKSMNNAMIDELDAVRVYMEQRRPESQNDTLSKNKDQVDPNQRCHTVAITMAEEIPFDLIWGMVRDDITNAVRELCPRNTLQTEDSIQEGVLNSGMGAIAKKLTLDEAERLASRVGHCVQTAVIVDQEELKKLREKEEMLLAQQAAKNGGKGALHSHFLCGLRVQFATKPLKSGSRAGGRSNAQSDQYNARGVIISRTVVGNSSNSGASSGLGGMGGFAAILAGGVMGGAPTTEILFDIISDDGVIYECLPRSRIKVSKQDLEKIQQDSQAGSFRQPPPTSSAISISGGSAGQQPLGDHLAPIVRLREHLRSAFPPTGGASAGASGAAADRPPGARGLFGALRSYSDDPVSVGSKGKGKGKSGKGSRPRPAGDAAGADNPSSGSSIATSAQQSAVAGGDPAAAPAAGGANANASASAPIAVNVSGNASALSGSADMDVSSPSGSAVASNPAPLAGASASTDPASGSSGSSSAAAPAAGSAAQATVGGAASDAAAQPVGNSSGSSSGPLASAVVAAAPAIPTAGGNVSGGDSLSGSGSPNAAAVNALSVAGNPEAVEELAALIDGEDWDESQEDGMDDYLHEFYDEEGSEEDALENLLAGGNIGIPANVVGGASGGSGGAGGSVVSGGAAGSAGAPAAAPPLAGSDPEAGAGGRDFRRMFERDRLVDQLRMMEEAFGGGRESFMSGNRDSRNLISLFSGGDSRGVNVRRNFQGYELLSGFENALNMGTMGRAGKAIDKETRKAGEVPLRNTMAGFTRSNDASDPRSTLEHAVAERIAQQDLMNDAKKIEAEDQRRQRAAKESKSSNRSGDMACSTIPTEDQDFREVRAVFRLNTEDGNSFGTSTSSSTSPKKENDGDIIMGHASDSDKKDAPMQRFPLKWNLFKVFQRMSDQTFHSQKSGEAWLAGDTSDVSMKASAASSSSMDLPKPKMVGYSTKDSAFPNKVNGLRKVPLEKWALQYYLDVTVPETATIPRLHEKSFVGVPDEARRSQLQMIMNVVEVENEEDTGRPTKRRKIADEKSNDTYREMYEISSLFGPERNHPVMLSSFCSNCESVLDSLELLAILKKSYLKSSYSADSDCAFKSEDKDLSPRKFGVEINSKLPHNHSKFWLNPKLDRKLRSQLDDPLSVITGALPWWAQTLTRVCPFLFSLSTRRLFLKYTAFGQAYAIHWIQELKLGPFLKRRQGLQTELNAAATDPRRTQILSQELSNVEEHIIRSQWWLGSLQSVLTKIEKNDSIIDTAALCMKRLNQFPSSTRLLEVQFENETGFGQAVTQSFYVELANRLIEREGNRKMPMWVEDEMRANGENPYIGQTCRGGLLIRPLDNVTPEIVERFRFFGRLVGKALREGFIIPVPLSEEFFALVREIDISSSSLPRPGTGYQGEFLGLMAEYVRAMRNRTRHARSEEERLKIMKDEASRRDFRERFLISNDEMSPTKASANSLAPCSFNEYCSDTGACFLETGFNGNPLVVGGDDIEINFENVEKFVNEATDFWFRRGVEKQVEAFREGFNDVVPIQVMWSLSPKELLDMICGEDRIEWDELQLQTHLHSSGTLTNESSNYKYLIEILIDMNQRDRQRFLDFVTSCPRLPPGGIGKLHIEVCGVNNKTAAGKSNSKLPYSRACSSQLYLPHVYASKEEMKDCLHEAMYSSVGNHEHRIT